MPLTYPCCKTTVDFFLLVSFVNILHLNKPDLFHLSSQTVLLHIASSIISEQKAEYQLRAILNPGRFPSPYVWRFIMSRQSDTEDAEPKCTPPTEHPLHGFSCGTDVYADPWPRVITPCALIAGGISVMRTAAKSFTTTPMIRGSGQTLQRCLNMQRSSTSTKSGYQKTKDESRGRRQIPSL